MTTGSRWPPIGVGTAGLLVLGIGLLAMPDRIAGWDPIQFALGIERFDLAMHRPHPPGYLGHLAIGRLLAELGLAPDRAILWTSLLESLGAVLALGALGRRLGGPAVGVSAAWILATNPLFLQQAVSGEVYPAEALLAVCLVLLGLSLDRASSRAQIGTLFLLLGLSGGVRQSLPLFLFPFALWRLWVARGPSGKEAMVRLGIAAFSGLAGIALWLVPLAWLAGGLGSLSVAFGRQFFRFFGQAYSPLLGASWVAFETNLQGLWRFLLQVLLLGGMVGLVLLPVAWIRRRSLSPDREFGWTALSWALPPLSWFTWLFIYKAGHALLLVPLASILAARMLRATVPSDQAIGRGWMAGGTALVAAVQLGWFLAPPSSWTRLTGDAGLPGIWYLDRETEAYTERVRDLAAGDPEAVLVVTRDGPFSFRRAMWHLPDTTVQWWMDRDSTGVPLSGVQVCEAREHEVRCDPGPGFWHDEPLPSRMEIALSSRTRHILWSVDPRGPVASLLDALPETHRQRLPGTPFECWHTRLPDGPVDLGVGPYRLVRQNRNPLPIGSRHDP